MPIAQTNLFTRLPFCVYLWNYSRSSLAWFQLLWISAGSQTFEAEEKVLGQKNLPKAEEEREKLALPDSEV